MVISPPPIVPEHPAGKPPLSGRGRHTAYVSFVAVFTRNLPQQTTQN
jgi:hypothetical protein